MDYPSGSGSDPVFVFGTDLRKRGTAARFNFFGYASSEWGRRVLSLSFLPQVRRGFYQWGPLGSMRLLMPSIPAINCAVNAR